MWDVIMSALVRIPSLINTSVMLGARLILVCPQCAPWFLTPMTNAVRSLTVVPTHPPSMDQSPHRLMLSTSSLWGHTTASRELDGNQGHSTPPHLEAAMCAFTTETSITKDSHGMMVANMFVPVKMPTLVYTAAPPSAHTSLRHSPVTADRSMFPASAVSHLPVTFQGMAPITPPLS